MPKYVIDFYFRSRGFVLCACAFFTGPALAQDLLPESATEPGIPSSNPPSEPHSVDREIRLAGNYFMGRGAEQNVTLAAYWYEKAAQAGDPQAQMQIGYFYETGTGVVRDPARAAHWYQLAAAGGLVSAKVNLGSTYMWGIGMPRNQQLAAQLFREAANEGSGLGACYLGDMYYFGNGVSQDLATAEKWYVKAVKLHDHRAEYELGRLFFSAKDHPHDLRKAASLLRNSALAGYVASMYSLGLLLIRNPGFAKSPAEPMAFLNDAADAGVWQASTILGALARDGNLVPLDSGAAYFHFRVAALQGGDEAQKTVSVDLHRLSSKLSPDQIQTIDSRADTWYRDHPVALEFVFRDRHDNMRFPAYAVAVPGSGQHAGRLLPAWFRNASETLELGHERIEQGPSDCASDPQCSGQHR